MIDEREAEAIATYVIADIHGEYPKFMDLLEKIRLKESDTLYILGDVQLQVDNFKFLSDRF